MLRGPSVHIRIGPSKVTTAVSMTSRASVAIVPARMRAILFAGSSAICSSGNLPSMLRWRVASQHWVEALAQLVGTLRS